MTAFIHVDQPQSHPGVARAEQVIAYAREQGRQVDGTRGLAAVMLAAVVAALAAVADKFVAHWTDGSLLAAWMVLWLVVFGAMALFAGAARDLAGRALAGWRHASERRAIARADARTLELARQDPRVMQDLQVAQWRAE